MTDALWVGIPAAGAGRRMQSAIPKQYLSLLGKPVIQHTIDALLHFPPTLKLVVGLSAEDEYWADTDCANYHDVLRCDGGSERSDTVLNILYTIQQQAKPDDWVMIHDAARPCVSQADLQALWQSRLQSPSGAILAVPTVDTMKQATTNLQIAKTVDRSSLWHAYTPQMFKLNDLLAALDQAKVSEQDITDEASAMELVGFSPLLIEGKRSNIKITRPEDLALAAFYLQEQS